MLTYRLNFEHITSLQFNRHFLTFRKGVARNNTYNVVAATKDIIFYR